MVPIIIESKKFCEFSSWFIPVGAITLYPFIICSDGSDRIMLNHEAIHIRQQQELLVIPFFIVYLINWAYNLVRFKGDTYKAYDEILFEKEAYKYERDYAYLDTRQNWSCFKDIF